ncbi:MAG TPA: YjdF family protein [bacterium]|nr:YjdF family protein [bacterium]HPN67207.1 YjdF family protein [bacterium]
MTSSSVNSVHVIKATISFNGQFWQAMFEQIAHRRMTIAHTFFPSEPTASEIYQYILRHFSQLRFTSPQSFVLTIKSPNHKRQQRAIKRELSKLRANAKVETYAQQVLRQEQEKNKLCTKSISRQAKQQAVLRKFRLRQAKKKAKHRGH